MSPATPFEARVPSKAVTLPELSTAEEEHLQRAGPEQSSGAVLGMLAVGAGGCCARWFGVRRILGHLKTGAHPECDPDARIRQGR